MVGAYKKHVDMRTLSRAKSMQSSLSFSAATVGSRRRWAVKP
jgi:hypothetical protein